MVSHVSPAQLQFSMHTAEIFSYLLCGLLHTAGYIHWVRLLICPDNKMSTPTLGVREKSGWLFRAVILWNKDSPASWCIVVASANLTAFAGDLSLTSNMLSEPKIPSVVSAVRAPVLWVLFSSWLHCYQKQKGRENSFFFSYLLPALLQTVRSFALCLWEF